jgi:RNA polymerase sigma factor (sigma-70 family)
MAGPEEQRLADLYGRYGPAIHRRALQILREPQDALDVTQEAFLAFMRLGPRFRGEASPFTVLYQIATHQALDLLRRRARWSGVLGHAFQTADGDGDEEPPAPVATQDTGGVPRVEAAMDLALLTHGEKPETMTCAYLYFVEGYTTEEIAQTLDLSRKTVGRMLAQFAARARKRSARLEPEPA